MNLRFGLVFVWMAVIFLFSHNPNSNEITEHYFGLWNYLVRKSAHLTEFAILFFLLRWALADLNPLERWNLRPQVVALVITVLYAASDEWHQSFVPGRSASLGDVLIDSAGAALAWVLWTGWQHLKPRAVSDSQ